MRLQAFQTFRDALRYPLHFHSVLFIVVGSLLLWLLSTSLFGIMLVVALATGFVHFPLHSLRNSALGDTTPPMLTSNDLVRPGSTPFKLLLTVLVWVSITMQASLLSPLAGAVLSAVGFVVLPAFTTLLVLEDSLHYALSPGRLSRFIVRGGVAYLLLATVLGVTLHLGVSEITDHVSGKGFSRGLVVSMPQVTALAWLMTGMYVATSFAHLLGRLASRAHDFRPPSGHEVPVTPGPDPDSAVTVATALAETLRKSTRENVMAEWGKHATRDCSFQEALLEHLVRERAWGLVPLQAQRTVTHQLAANRQMAALHNVMHTLNDFESFRTASCEEWLKVCEVASTAGRSDWLSVLAEKAPRKFPDNPKLVNIALLHARHLATCDNNIAGALHALQPFLDQHSHPLHSEVLRFSRALQAMQPG